jgi:hypothetical protein
LKTVLLASKPITLQYVKGTSTAMEIGPSVQHGSNLKIGAGGTSSVSCEASTEPCNHCRPYDANRPIVLLRLEQAHKIRQPVRGCFRQSRPAKTLLHSLIRNQSRELLPMTGLAVRRLWCGQTTLQTPPMASCDNAPHGYYSRDVRYYGVPRMEVRAHAPGSAHFRGVRSLYRRRLCHA